MSWNLRFLQPAPHIKRISPKQAQEKYPKLRWRILEATFIGYATFYLVRNNLPVVSKEMGQALNYSKDQIGNMLAVMVAVYGLGRFVMGSLSDRSNPRYFMSLGLLLTAACNFAFGAASSYHAQLALWAIERAGAKHGMGALRTLAEPLVQHSRARHGLRFLESCAKYWRRAYRRDCRLFRGAAGLEVGVLCAGILATICAVYLIVRLRDTPQSEGLPSIEEYKNDYPDGGNGDGEKELGTRELLVDYILKNRYLWLIAGANFFVYIARYAMLDWGPTFLKEVKHASLGEGGMGTATLEFSAMLSTVSGGMVLRQDRRPARNDLRAVHDSRVPGVRGHPVQPQ